MFSAKPRKDMCATAFFLMEMNEKVVRLGPTNSVMPMKLRLCSINQYYVEYSAGTGTWSWAPRWNAGGYYSVSVYQAVNKLESGVA